MLSSTTHVVHLRYRTRDLFEVTFKLKDTGERLAVIAAHWPSRRLGQQASEPLRIAVGENVAYLVEAHVKVTPVEYETLRALDDLAPVQQKWDAKVMVIGDFNDEPGDTSVVSHLKASRELDRVIGETNDIDRFKDETADYRAQDVFLYNPMWKFVGSDGLGTHFLDSTSNGERMTNRYACLDQIVVSRGLLASSGLRLDRDSVAIFHDPLVATPSGRPRGFDRKTKKGTSDHLPVTAKLVY